LKYLKTLLFIALLFAVGWFVRATDWAKVGLALQQIGWNFIWLLVATFLAAWCGAIGWRYCLGEQGRQVRFYDLFLIRHIGETVGLVNPTGMVGGEALKAAMLRNKNIDQHTVIASVVLSRVLTILTQLLLFGVVALCLYGASVMRYLGQFSGWILAISATALLLWWWLRGASSPIQKRRIMAWLPESWQQQLSSVKTSLRFALQQRAAVGWASLYLTLHWVLGGVEFYLILLFLGTDATLLEAIFVDMGVVFFKVAGTVVPGQVGVEEYGNKVMLEAIEVQGAELYIAASILRRARQLFWIGFGLLTYFIYYHKWRTAPSIPDGNPVRHP
jgi:glycosyltransferase 2 family protein